jgi:menaquinone-9 beta-reductase
MVAANNTTSDLNFDSDVLIVGAGPAGSSAAYYLSKSGIKVLLLDRQTFPRDKVCGDFVSPVAIRELQALGVTELPEFKKTNVVTKATIHLDGKELITNAMPYFAGLEPNSRVIPRKTMDNWILYAAKKAGAVVLEDVLVTDFSVEKNFVKIHAKDSKGPRSFCSRLLIGADGSNSLVAHVLRGYSPPKTDRIVGVRGYYENVEGESSDAEMFFASKSFPGYCWLFPTGKGEANVGVGVLLETFPRGNQPKELLNQLISEDPGLKKRLANAKLKEPVQAWPLCVYNPDLPIVGNRVMLIGEAAGLVNSLNGEGIQYALLSGKWAAQIAQLSMGKDDFSANALSAYSKRVENELGYGFKLSTLIVQFIRNRNLNPLWLQTFEAMVARAKSDQQYANLAGAILAGLVPPTEALTPEFMLSTLQEATVSTGLKMFGDTASNPASLPKTAIKTVQTVIDVGVSTVQNPVGFLEWGMCTGLKMIEFATVTPMLMLKEMEKTNRKPFVAES